MSHSFAPLVLATCVLATLVVVPRAEAADNHWAAIAVNVTPPVPVAKTCDNVPSGPAGLLETGVCGELLDGYTAWILVCRGSDSTGVAGMEFGIQYDGSPSSGIDVNAWTLCADLEFPGLGWPAAGTGTILTWDGLNNCRNMPSEPFVPYTVLAWGGALDVTYHGADDLSIVPRPASGLLKVADCSAAEDHISGLVPSRAGPASFCRSAGYNPCASLPPIAVEQSTWATVKRKYVD